MVFIYVPHKNDGKKPAPHETAIALFIVALLMLAFAIVAVLAGPKVGSPPPPIVPWVLITLFAMFGLAGFFSWLKWQGEGDAAPRDSDSGEEK